LLVIKLWTKKKNEIVIYSDGPEFGFDRVMSKDMDNTVGDDRKSSKTIDANVSTFKFWQSPVSVAANDEAFALAA